MFFSKLTVLTVSFGYLKVESKIFSGVKPK